MREIIDAAWRKVETVPRHRQTAGVGDRRHLDRGFGAIEKGIEHLRVHPAAPSLFRRQAVMRPYLIWRHSVIRRQILGPFSGGGDLKTTGACPVDLLADERRLVAIGERI